MDIRSALLRSGKEEFLAHGFEDSSLRTICKNAGVTTGAFYSHFSRKEDLFLALVEPMLAEFGKVYGEVIRREIHDLTTGAENELTSISYAIRHRDEFRLLFECAKGTKYAGFKDWLLEEFFLPGYQAVFDSHAGRPVDPALVRVVLGMKFEEYMELIFGGYSMEQVKKLITLLAVFSEAGFYRLLEELESDNL